MSSTTLEPNPSTPRRARRHRQAHPANADRPATASAPARAPSSSGAELGIHQVPHSAVHADPARLHRPGGGGLRCPLRLGHGTVRRGRCRDPEAAAAFAAQGGDLAVGVPTSGIAFAQLILGSLGVLLMSSEFTTGMARSTFAAVPKRTPAFAAKLLVVMVTAFVLTAVSVYLAGLVSLPILDNYDLKLDLASSQSVKMLLVNSVYVAAVAAIGMALGSLHPELRRRHHEPGRAVLRGTDRLPADSGRLLRRGP